MDITSKKWRVRGNLIEERLTNQMRVVSGIPQDNTLALMHEKTFDRKCQQAFAHGTWPESSTHG